MARSYPRGKGRSGSERHVQIPNRFLDHANFIRLTPRAVKLFIDLLMQYNGRNNGDLVATFSIMKKRGWRSSETLHLAIDELLHYGWITRTRLGGLPSRAPCLFAVTFHDIDECGGKLDVEPSIASGSWKQLVDDWEKPASYKAIDRRRKNKSSLRNPKRITSDSVTVVPIKARK